MNILKLLLVRWIGPEYSGSINVQNSIWHNNFFHTGLSMLLNLIFIFVKWILFGPFLLYTYLFKPGPVPTLTKSKQKPWLTSKNNINSVPNLEGLKKKCNSNLEKVKGFHQCQTCVCKTEARCAFYEAEMFCVVKNVASPWRWRHKGFSID